MRIRRLSGSCKHHGEKFFRPTSSGIGPRDPGSQQEVTSNLDFDVGYVHWFKGSYFDSPAIVTQMPAGGNKDRDYFYAQMRVRI